jgi:hypothetical protein
MASFIGLAAIRILTGCIPGSTSATFMGVISD